MTVNDPFLSFLPLEDGCLGNEMLIEVLIQVFSVGIDINCIVISVYLEKAAVMNTR